MSTCDTVWDRRRSQGLCGGCGSRPPEEGKTLCTPCLEKRREERKNVEYRTACWRCRKNPPVEGKRKCAVCIGKDKAKTDEFRAKGICTGCKKRPALEGRNKCLECTEYSRSRTKKARELGMCMTCRTREAEEGKKACKRCRLVSSKRRKELKVRVLKAYGGCRCSCPGCSETLVQLLTIDHVNNDGKAHRERLWNGSRVYKDLEDRGFPEGFRVLCMSCNWGRKHGECPHLAEIDKVLHGLSGIHLTY